MVLNFYALVRSFIGDNFFWFERKIFWFKRKNILVWMKKYFGSNENIFRSNQKNFDRTKKICVRTKKIVVPFKNNFVWAKQFLRSDQKYFRSDQKIFSFVPNNFSFAPKNIFVRTKNIFVQTTIILVWTKNIFVQTKICPGEDPDIGHIDTEVLTPTEETKVCLWSGVEAQGGVQRYWGVGAQGNTLWVSQGRILGVLTFNGDPVTMIKFQIQSCIENSQLILFENDRYIRLGSGKRPILLTFLIWSLIFIFDAKSLQICDKKCVSNYQQLAIAS